MTPASELVGSGEIDEGRGGGFKPCNCKKSKCLKLYCECFARGRYCDGCNCTNCFNNSTHESVRREAVEQTLERNPVCVRGRPLGEACALFCQGRACARLSVCQRRGWMCHVCREQDVIIACALACRPARCRPLSPAVVRRRASLPVAVRRRPLSSMVLSLIHI